MKLLLDECLPRKLKREFVGHEVFTVDEAGFKGLKNGKLIQAASENDFEVLISVDKNIAPSAKPSKFTNSGSRFIGKNQPH